MDTIAGHGGTRATGPVASPSSTPSASSPAATPEAAASALAAARADLLARVGRIADAETRRAFLALPEHVRTLALAEARLGAGCGTAS